MIRIDGYPIHKSGEFRLRAGKPLTFGATIVPGGVNFSVYSRHATSCELVLFKKHEAQPFAAIPFPDEFGTGNVFTMIVFDLEYKNIEYGFRMHGPFNPREGHWFDRTKILMDPHAKAIGGRDMWGDPPNWEDIYPHRTDISIQHTEMITLNCAGFAIKIDKADFENDAIAIDGSIMLPGDRCTLAIESLGIRTDGTVANGNITFQVAPIRFESSDIALDKAELSHGTITADATLSIPNDLSTVTAKDVKITCLFEVSSDPLR